MQVNIRHWRVDVVSNLGKRIEKEINHPSDTLFLQCPGLFNLGNECFHATIQMTTRVVGQELMLIRRKI